MFTQFFGNYLLNKGLVDTKQLSDALAVQKQTRPRLGVLAINAGYMTAEQVDKVHEEQQRVDKRIGDIACDMGFLTHEQVEELLSSQGAAHLQLGQALVDTGAYLTEYIALLFKNIIRFIGDDFTPLAPKTISEIKPELAAVQKITGAFNCTTAVSGDEKAYLGFASRYAGEELNTLDEMAHASCGEFLNLHNGLFTVNVSNEMNTELKLMPQDYLKNDTLSGNIFEIPLVFPFGTVSFMAVL